MSVLTYAAKIYKRFSRAQYLAWAVIVLAVAALFVIGFFLGRNSAAATMRDCGEGPEMNSIANNPDSGGGCGALTPDELITDINNGDPDDQAGIFAHFGLPAGSYDRFKATARTGTAFQDGTIKVDDQVVMTDAWSIGRKKFGYSQAYPIEGVGSYFKSAHTDVLKSNIPVMVMFDTNGEVEAAVLKSCGNPVKGKKVKSSAECKKLNKQPVEGKENTYKFTTEVALTGLAKVVKVEYFANGVQFAREDKPSTPVTKTFTEDTTVVAKVTVSFPGKQKKQIESELCKQQITVKKKEVPPPAVVEQPKPTPEQPKPQVLPAKVEAAVTPLPVTGPEGAAGLFVGTSLAGAIGHRLYMIYRGRKNR